MSEISIDTMPDNDAWHPSIPPHTPREFDAELLKLLSLHLAGAITQQHARHNSQEVLQRCIALREELDRAISFLSGAQPEEENESLLHRLFAASERQARLTLADGNSTLYEVGVRYVAFVWTFFPHLTGAKTATALMRYLGIKDKQQFHRYTKEWCETYNYQNPLMRSETSKAHMRMSMARRTVGEANAEE